MSFRNLKIKQTYFSRYKKNLVVYWTERAFIFQEQWSHETWNHTVWKEKCKQHQTEIWSLQHTRFHFEKTVSEATVKRFTHWDALLWQQSKLLPSSASFHVHFKTKGTMVEQKVVLKNNNLGLNLLENFINLQRTCVNVLYWDIPCVLQQLFIPGGPKSNSSAAL